MLTRNTLVIYDSFLNNVSDAATADNEGSDGDGYADTDGDDAHSCDIQDDEDNGDDGTTTITTTTTNDDDTNVCD